MFERIKYSKWNRTIEQQSTTKRVNEGTA